MLRYVKKIKIIFIKKKFIMKRFITLTLAIIAIAAIGRTYILKNQLGETQEILDSIRVELDSTKVELSCVEQELASYKNDNSLLSDWDMFTLALMKVESNYKPTAVSSVGAKGYFQIMPIYVDEVNRVHKTNYVYEDVVNSFEQSYEVFTLMQEAHNKDFNMDKALKLHNGDHKWYRRRVYNEMANIARYEEMRHMLKNTDIG
jgi:hypothetical protein